MGDRFLRDDALRVLEWVLEDDRGYIDAIHASPPCQAYSQTLKGRPSERVKHPELIEPVRELLEAIAKPYVIENVEGSPLRDPVTLCGHMDEFPELRVIRHRLFETNWDLPQPDHVSPHPLCFTMDKRKPHYGKLDEWESYVTVTGGGNCSADCARDAMGIDWMNKAHLNEAIPPAFARYIGAHLMKEAAPKDRLLLTSRQV